MAIENVDTVARLPFVISSAFLIRTISAFVAIILLLMAIHFGSPYYDILAGFATFGMLRELSRMTLGKPLHPLVFVFFFQMHVILYGQYIPHSVKTPLTFTILLTTVWILTKTQNSIRSVILMLGSVYICAGTSAFVKLMNLGGSSINFVYWMLILIWINDTAAFIIGKKWGKKKLAPRISPHKTWEGFLGALIVGTISAIIMAYAFKIHSLFVAPMLLAVLLLSISVHAGDLIESSIKRFCNVKDTGKLIPGHGGILDRLDSFLFVNIIVSIFYFIGFLRFD